MRPRAGATALSAAKQPDHVAVSRDRNVASLSVPCPVCHAGVDVHCTNPSGAKSSHTPRRRMALRAEVRTADVAPTPVPAFTSGDGVCPVCTAGIALMTWSTASQVLLPVPEQDRVPRLRRHEAGAAKASYRALTILCPGSLGIPERVVA